MKERFFGISRNLLEKVRGELCARPQVEHCGLLLARPEATLVEKEVAYPGPLQPREFRLPEEWMLETFLLQRQRGFEVAGFYHTHPPGEPLEPSALDLSGHPPGALVLLLSLHDWKAYRVGTTWLRLPLEEL